MTAEYLDPNEFYRAEMDSWESIWNEELNLYENIYEILESSVLLPQKKLMLPIVATYLLIPSKWARVLPILFSCGGKGSGKSTTSIFASKLHGLNSTFSATDTFSAIRNALDTMRWIDPNDKELEKDGVILCWDNIHSGTFKKDERIYQMMLFGYNRSTDKILIAQTDGTNREFRVFSPKIISSVEPLHLNPELEELQRRLLIIPHKSFDKFSKEELAQYPDFDPNDDRLDLDSIHWDGIENEFFKFWSKSDNCKLYAKFRTFLSRRGKKEYKHSIKSEQWIISIDLIATGLVVGAWDSVPNAISHMQEYWNFINNKVLNNSSATLEHLEAFIEEEVGVMREMNKILEQHGKPTTPLIVNAQKLKNRLDYHKGRGELDVVPSVEQVGKLMNLLGWRITKKGWMETK
jgi:hypothetical protein